MTETPPPTPPTAPPPAVLTCYRHPGRETGVTCARCERPICPECMTPASVGFQCPECIREGRATIRAPRRGGGLQAAGRRWGYVTLSLIAINIAMFVVSAISAVTVGHSPLNNYDSPFFDALSQWPYGVILLDEWWRIVTAAFLHVGPVHLVLNMLALLVFGSELERALGRWRFLALYFVSILGGAAAIQMFGSPGTPVAGASTALYGLLGG